VNKVFFDSDTGRNGQITQSQLQEFMDLNPVETAHVAKECCRCNSDPITLGVLQLLEQSESGNFDKRQVTAAVKQLAVENGIALNGVILQSLMSKVFTKADFRKSKLINRLALHISLDSFAAETEELF
jgi:hypothetical protein